MGPVIREMLVPTGTADPDLHELELVDAPPTGVGPGGWGDVPGTEATVVAPVPSDPELTVRHAFPVVPAAAPPAPAPAAPPESATGHPLPGSRGEHLLQERYGTERRARRFYQEQMLDRLNDEMTRFVGRMEMAFVATADGAGECDASLRSGPPGFIRVLDPYHVAYPEYRGNGVMASLGNIEENPHVGILMLDMVQDLIGLHVNGRASVVEDAELRARHPDLPEDDNRGRTPERWVVVRVEEAYVHCRKHIPRMMPVPRDRSWGTDDARRKGGDYFEAKGDDRPWRPVPDRHSEPAPG